jgi:hypothetical protein
LLLNSDFFSPTQVQRGLKSSKDMNKTHRDKETDTEPKKKRKKEKRLLHMKAQKAVIRNKYSPA